MNADMRWFAGRIADAQLRVAELERRTDHADTADRGLLLELIEELRTSSEELQVANEELRAQADEISAARAIIEQDRLRYRDLFLAAPDAYVVTDALGVIQEANPQAAGLLGLSTDALLGRPLALHVAPLQRQAFRRELDTLKATTSVHQLTVRLHDRDTHGEADRDLSARVRVVRPPDGRLELCWLLHDRGVEAGEAEQLHQLEASLRGAPAEFPVPRARSGEHLDRANALAGAAAYWWEDVIAAAHTSDPDGGLRDQLRRGTGLLTEMTQTLMQQATDTVQLERLVSQLQTALDSRIAIEQAKGKLAERLSCSPQDAFELLRRYARTNNLLLHDFAARFVSGDTDLEAKPPPE